jgi:hypothetical protein
MPGKEEEKGLFKREKLRCRNLKKRSRRRLKTLAVENAATLPSPLQKGMSNSSNEWVKDPCAGKLPSLFLEAPHTDAVEIVRKDLSYAAERGLQAGIVWNSKEYDSV